MAAAPAFIQDGAMLTAASFGSSTRLPVASTESAIGFSVKSEGHTSAWVYWLVLEKVGNGAAMPPVDQTSPEAGKKLFVQKPPLCPLRALGSGSPAVQVPAGQPVTSRRSTVADRSKKPPPLPSPPMA